MIVVIDYGMGNLKSVVNALKILDMKYKVSDDIYDINNAAGLILPGVGSYKDAIDNLEKRNLIKIIKDKVKKGCPILGICLGMQMFYEKGYEVEERQGLGFLKGEIRLMEPKCKVKIPHIGWNRLEIKKNHKVVKDLSQESFVYFVHSYLAAKTNKNEIIACSEYGGIEIPALVGRDNILGAQFHPEKSGEEGLKILKEFGEMIR